MEPPANSSHDRDGSTVVGKTFTSKIYHLLTRSESKSLCGTLNDETFLGSHVALTLTETKAQQRGFILCENCAQLAEK
jgi:hypothetical protein